MQKVKACYQGNHLCAINLVHVIVDQLITEVNSILRPFPSAFLEHLIITLLVHMDRHDTNYKYTTLQPTNPCRFNTITPLSSLYKLVIGHLVLANCNYPGNPVITDRIELFLS